MKKLNINFSILFLVIMFSCGKKDSLPESSCPESNEILDEFVSDRHYILSLDGQLFAKKDGDCEYLLQYFSPDFESNYFQKNDTVYAYLGDSSIQTVNNSEDNFDNYENFIDLFILSPSTTDHKWTDFILLSPQNPTVNDYVALRSCIIEGTCDFVDNRIDIVTDSITNTGKLKFTSFAPVTGMVTSKSSIENTLIYAKINNEVLIEGDFYIEEGFPFSIIDLENGWFEESPGIRLVFDENENLSVELKYGTKPWYKQEPGQEISFPTDEWVNIKVSFVLRNDETGQIKVWQNNTLIIDKIGQTLPTSNSIQTNIEIGITATDQNTIMYLDNFRIMVNKL